MPLRRVQTLFALVGVAEAAILPFLPIVLLERGLSAAEIGVVLALGSVAAVVAAPAWGVVADRRLGAERTLVLAAVAAAAASVMLVFVDGFAGLAVAVVAVTAFRSPMASLLDAIALEHLGASRGEYGPLRLWMSIGWAVAACIWGGLLQAGSLELLPVLYAASVLVAAYAAHAVGGDGVRYAPSEPGARRAMARALATFLLSLLFVFAAFSATFSFVAVRLDELGGGLLVIGVAAALQAVAEVPVMWATPRLSRALGDRRLYVTGTVFVAGACLGWALLDNTIAIAAIKLLVGVGLALVYVGSVVIVDDLVPPSLRSTGQGLARAVCFGVAPIAGSVVGGAVYGYAGPRALFLVSALSALVAGASVGLISLRARRIRLAAAYED